MTPPAAKVVLCGTAPWLGSLDQGLSWFKRLDLDQCVVTCGHTFLKVCNRCTGCNLLLVQAPDSARAGVLEDQNRSHIHMLPDWSVPNGVLLKLSCEFT